MEKKYKIDVSFPDVEFDVLDSESEKCPDIFPGQLIVRENEIEIQLFYDSKIKFEWKFNFWLKKINWKQFGKYIKVSNISSNDNIKSASFIKAKLLKVNNGSRLYQGNLSCTSLFVDWICSDWSSNELELNTAEFYLNDAGFNMVNCFYSPLISFDGNFEISRMAGKENYYKIGTTEFRPEFNFYKEEKINSKEAKIIKEPKLQFNFNKETLFEELIENVETVCLILLFYYQLKIDFLFARIHLENKTVTIKKILEPQLDKIVGISSLWSVQYHKQIDEFLKLNWQNGAKSNLKKLKKVIPKFYQSTVVEGSSSFLLRYNIVEICKGGKRNNNEKFGKILDDKEHEEKYNEALEILLNTVSKDDAEDFKKKWENVKGKLEYRPMKSDIEEFLINQNINIEELTISVSELVQMRSDLTHGSITRVKPPQLEEANLLLYRLSVILILNMLGLNDIWKLEKKKIENTN